MTVIAKKDAQTQATQGDSVRIAIQGERGSNSHMATLEMLASDGRQIEIVPCSVSADVIEAECPKLASRSMLVAGL